MGEWRWRGLFGLALVVVGAGACSSNGTADSGGGGSDAGGDVGSGSDVGGGNDTGSLEAGGDAAGDAGDASVPADVSGGGDAIADAQPDVPSCSPAMPDPTVIAPGGTDMTTLVDDVIVTSSGEVAVFYYAGLAGEAARTWENGAWSSHNVVPPSNGGAGYSTVGDIGGRPARFATTSDATNTGNAPRYWLQLSDGSFAAGQTIPGFDAGSVMFTQYAPSTSVLSAVGIDINFKSLVYLERNAAGTWNVAPLASTSIQFDNIFGAGLGTLSDHTAFAGAYSGSGFELYRRSGTTWAQYRTLAPAPGTNQFYRYARIVAPPDGSAGARAVAVYGDPATGGVKALSVSLADGTPGGTADLLTTPVPDAAVDIVYRPDGASGLILVYDNNNRNAWIASFEGTSFTTGQELRPDLVFDAPPRLVSHPCGGTMILHATRATSDTPGSEPLVLEPLATFWPGH